MAFYAPDPIQSTQFIPGGNTPASGALLFCYSVGTTAKQNTYTDASASTARTNPIVLDSGGNVPGNGEVWIASSAKFVLAPSNDTDPPSSPYWTRDGLPGLNNVTSGIFSEWVQGSTATFVGVTAFSVVGDQTALYTLGRRIKATVTGGDRFGIVSSSALSGGSTAVGITIDSSTLNAGLSNLWYGILGTPNGSVPWVQITSTGIFIEGNTTTGPLLVNSSATIAGSTTILGTLNVSSGIFGAGLNYIASTVANSTTFVAFNSSVINGLYDEYEFHLHSVIPTVNGANAYVRVSSSNGASWASTTVYTYAANGCHGIIGFAQGPGASTSEILISVSTGVSNNANTGGFTNIIKLYRPSETTAPFKRLSFFGLGAENGGNSYNITGMGTIDSTFSQSAINAIQFLWSAGSTSVGNFYAYGLRR